MNEPPQRPTPQRSLKARALRYLAAREHSRAELATKLARQAGPEADPEAIARVLDELAAKGFINETRVAESILHRRAGRLGAARVLQELRAKDLPEDVLRDAAEQLRETELARAHAVRERKFGAAPPTDLRERARQLRFLAARGFSGETARRAIAGVPDDHE